MGGAHNQNPDRSYRSLNKLIIKIHHVVMAVCRHFFVMLPDLELFGARSDKGVTTVSLVEHGNVEDNY